MLFRKKPAENSLRRGRPSAARCRRPHFEQFEDRSLLATAALIPPPLASYSFGEQVVPLANGNVVVTASNSHYQGQFNGAVFLYDGETGELISMLRGHDYDTIGSGGIVPLTNGNFVVVSPEYGGDGSLPSRGAITWVNGETGLNGFVDETNSLVGAIDGQEIGADFFGNPTVFPLPGGDYVVLSARYPGGAVTLGDGETGTTGVISTANSLIGMGGKLDDSRIEILSNGNAVVLGNEAAIFIDPDEALQGLVDATNSLTGFPERPAGEAPTLFDVVEVGDSNYVVVTEDSATWADGDTGITGLVNSTNSLLALFRSITGVTVLSTGDYVVVAPSEPIGEPFIEQVAKGAVTWADGDTGIVGQISAANSLVGAVPSSYLGSGGVVALANGSYVVLSPDTDTATTLNVGSVTWAPAGGLIGTISPANSLYGTKVNDRVGSGGVVELTNGNYVVRSPLWDTGSVEDVGAVTWARGNQAISGQVSSANSLIGATEDDSVGSTSVTALKNGNYVVASESWDDNTKTNVGAVTWGNGATGTTGVVAAANSLIGSTAEDRIGTTITPLTNGNFVVLSPHWNNGGVANSGALTWQRGNVATSAVVSPTNSFVGTHTGDFQTSFHNGEAQVVPLTNGNYVFAAPGWNGGTFEDVGAVTFGRGNTALTGTVNSLASLIGTTAYSDVGQRVIALTNGNYVVYSELDTNKGAITLGSGTTGIAGPVSAANSLVGAQNGDLIAGFGLVPLTNGNFVYWSGTTDNGAIVNAGSASWGSGTTPLTGSIVTGTPNHVVSKKATGAPQSIVIDEAHGRFFAPFMGEGVIRIGDLATGFRTPLPEMRVSIPKDLQVTAGNDVLVPVTISTLPSLAVNQLTSVQLMVYFDPGVIEVLNVYLGNVFNGAPGLWTITPEINALAGYVHIRVTGTEPLPANPVTGQIVGTLVQLSLRANAAAAAGQTALNLATGARNTAHVTQLNNGSVVLLPLPTPSAADAVDGLLKIVAGPSTPPPNVPSANVERGELQVRGTEGNDFILIVPLSPALTRVRVNNFLLGDFATPTQLHVNALAGQNHVYIGPPLNELPSVILGAGEATEEDSEAAEDGERSERSVRAARNTGASAAQAHDWALLEWLAAMPAE